MCIRDSAYEFMSWHVFVGDVFLFAWRVPTGKPAPDDYHDVWNAIEVSTGNQLWQREVPWHDPPGVHALGKDLVLIDDWQRVSMIEARTGLTRGAFAKSDGSFSVSKLSLIHISEPHETPE